MFLNPADLRGSPDSTFHHIRRALEKLDFAIFVFISLSRRTYEGIDFNRRGTH
jgi:hypothetical protein